MSANAPTQSNNATAWFYIIFWITCSCVMILFNKAVISTFNFPFPMFLTLWHMILSTIMTQILSRTTNLLPAVAEKKVTTTVLQTQILPVSLFFAVSLVLSNKAYIYLSVSYIQMLKAFTPVAVLIFSFFAGLEKPSYHEFYIVLVISIGVAMTSIGELDFSLLGFAYQLAALIAEASRLVLTNILLKTLKLDPLSSLYYIAPMCSIFISLAFFVFEYDFLPWDMILTTNFMIMMLINGIIAFTLNIAVVMLISNTSALVLTLAGIIKDILLVTLSIVVFMSPITLLQIIGYSIALIGLNLHKEYKKSPERVVEILNSFMCWRQNK